MQNTKFFQLIPSGTSLDFIGKFKVFMAFSLLCVAGSITLMLTKGFHFGVDFTGGTVMQIKYAQPTSAETVRKQVAEAGAPDATVAAFGRDEREYMITARALSDTKEKDTLAQRLVVKVGADNVKVESVEVVGPKVGAELKLSALRALFYSIIIITIYIWLRFDARFAPGATFAMLHDIVLAAGYYVVFGKEFNITAVAALLTIAGYSVNDTIVIYDRVRELMKSGGAQLPLGDTINKAINLTLSRTLLTSSVTLISVVPIALFCSGEIRDFAEAMIFGIFVGTYSTIYVAAPLTIYVERFLERKDRKGKRVTGKPATV